MEQQQDSNVDVVITATYDDYLAFLVSSVWRDMQTELSVQKGMIEDALAAADEPREIYRLQGKLEACKDFLGMPEDFTRLLEDRFNQPTPSEAVAAGENLTSDVYYDQLLDEFKGE